MINSGTFNGKLRSEVKNKEFNLFQKPEIIFKSQKLELICI